MIRKKKLFVVLYPQKTHLTKTVNTHWEYESPGHRFNIMTEQRRSAHVEFR